VHRDISKFRTFNDLATIWVKEFHFIDNPPITLRIESRPHVDRSTSIYSNLTTSDVVLFEYQAPAMPAQENSIGDKLRTTLTIDTDLSVAQVKIRLLKELSRNRVLPGGLLLRF
jgi:hypothetical protein